MWARFCDCSAHCWLLALAVAWGCRQHPDALRLDGEERWGILGVHLRAELKNVV
jgi:hypothetical protein